MKERKKLTRLAARKYRKSGKREKTATLNTFISQTGYERKHAVRLLANGGKIKPLHKTARLAAAHGSGPKRIYEKTYGNDALGALRPIWEAFNYQCGKLLAPFLRASIACIAREPKSAVSEAARLKPGSISAASCGKKRRIKGACGTKAAKGHIKPLIPVMSHFECREQGPGLWQIGLAQHGGGNPSGGFCFTLSVTGVEHCQAVHFALRNKAFKWVFAALDRALSAFPLPETGFKRPDRF